MNERWDQSTGSADRQQDSPGEPQDGISAPDGASPQHGMSDTPGAEGTQRGAGDVTGASEAQTGGAPAPVADGRWSGPTDGGTAGPGGGWSPSPYSSAPAQPSDGSPVSASPYASGPAARPTDSGSAGWGSPAPSPGPSDGSPTGAPFGSSAPSYGSPASAPAYGAAAGAATTQAPGDAPVGGQPPKKSRLGLILGVVGGCLVLGLVVIVIVVFAVVRSQRQAEEEAASASAEAAAAREEAIVGPVQGYLDALAAGDAETALSHLDPELADLESPLLTDDALAVSLEAAPITDVVVTPESSYPEDEYSYQVGIAYTLGETPVEGSWTVSDTDGDGVYLLESGTGSVSFYGLDGLTYEINGVSVEGTDFEVFPGTYTAQVTTEYLGLDGDAVAQVTEPGEYADGGDASVVLTEDGTDFARGLVRDAVEKCLESKDYEAGCGFDLPETLTDGTKVDQGSIQRSLNDETNKALDEMTFTVDYGDPTRITGASVGPIEVEITGEQDGQRGTGTVTGSSNYSDTPVIDLAEDEPSVGWE